MAKLGSRTSEAEGRFAWLVAKLHNSRLVSINRETTVEETMFGLKGLPITLEKLNKTIKLLPCGKTPGIYVIPSKFYKTFAEELSPKIHSMRAFNAVIDMSTPTINDRVNNQPYFEKV